MSRYVFMVRSAVHPGCKRWLEASSRHTVAELADLIHESFGLPSDRHWSLFTHTPWSESGWYGPEAPDAVQGWPGRALADLGLEASDPFFLLHDLAREHWFEGLLATSEEGNEPASPRRTGSTGDLPPRPPERGEELLPDPEERARRRSLSQRFAQSAPPSPLWDPEQIDEGVELAREMLRAARGDAGRLTSFSLGSATPLAPWVILLAEALGHAGRADDGVALAEEYAAILDDDDILTGLATLLSDIDPEEALRRGEACLERFPDSFLARLTLARLLAEPGRDLERARRLAAEAHASAEPRQIVQREMAAELLDLLGAPTAGSAVPAAPEPRAGRGAGRSEPCPCGSGKKRERCCGEGEPRGDVEHRTMTELLPRTLEWILRPERADEVEQAWSVWSGESRIPEELVDPEAFLEDDIDGWREAFYAWLAFEWRAVPEAPSLVERWGEAAGRSLDARQEKVVERLASSRLRLYAVDSDPESGTGRLRDLIAGNCITLVAPDDLLEACLPEDLVAARIVELDGRPRSCTDMVFIEPALKPGLLSHMEAALEAMQSGLGSELSWEDLLDRVGALLILGVWSEIQDEDDPFGDLLAAGLSEDDLCVDGEPILDARAHATLADPSGDWSALARHPEVRHQEPPDLYWIPLESPAGVDLSSESLGAIFRLEGRVLEIDTVSRSRLHAAEAFVQQVLDRELSFRERIESPLDRLAGPSSGAPGAGGLSWIDEGPPALASCRLPLVSPREAWRRLEAHPETAAPPGEEGKLLWPRTPGPDNASIAVLGLQEDAIVLTTLSESRLREGKGFLRELLGGELAFEDMETVPLDALLGSVEDGLSDEPVIEEILEEFLEEQEARLSARTYRTYEEVVHYLYQCLDGYGHSLLMGEEKRTYERAGESGIGFCDVFGAEQLLRAYPEFLGWFLVRKADLTKSLARSAGTVTKKLARWLTSRGYVSSEIGREALEHAAAARRDLPAAVELRDILVETTMRADFPLDDESEILDDQFRITRVLDDRIWLSGLLEGGDLGPVRLPREAAERCRLGWTISGALTETGDGWRLVEAWNVYPE